MKREIVPIDDGLGEKFVSFWDQAVSTGGVRIETPSGRGGIRSTGPKKFEWDATDTEGRRIDPVEVTKVCGKFELTYNILRKWKIGGLRGLDRFGKVPPPPNDEKDCRFFESNAEHPASILRRPYLGIVGPSITLAAIPNAFPAIKDGQYLLVSAEFNQDEQVRYPHIPQVLTRGLLFGLLSVAAAAGPDWSVAFNSIGGGASVAHFHGQLVRTKFPIEQMLRIRIGQLFYNLGWPAGCVGVENADLAAVWGLVERLQEHDVPINLVIRDRTALIFGRRPEHELTAEFPSNVMAFLELSGKIQVSDESVIAFLTEDLIATAMRRTTLSVEEILAIVA